MTEKSDADIFTNKVAYYEALVDWPKRLANEEPFFRTWFNNVGATSVLDVACGTGNHAGMFHSWGMEVEGADISEAMIEHCRAHHGESERLRWVLRSFEQPCETPGEFDAVVCLGNSLSLVKDGDCATRTLHAMMRALRPGGVCIVQVLNAWRIPEGPTVWQKFKRVHVDGEERILIKGMHRVGRRAYIDLLCISVQDAKSTLPHKTSVLYGFEAPELVAALEQAGAKQFELFGDYTSSPYAPQHSPDLIVVCRR